MIRIAEQCRAWLLTPAAHVLLAAGALGIGTALMVHIPWPDALEPAQVLAGVVHYPSDSPLYLYSTTTWTLLHQGAAALLASGINERAVAMVITALSGMIAFQGLALIVWTFSEQRALSIAAPLLIYVSNATNASVTYPVALIGSPATYGMIGMSALMLTVGLIASGQARIGALVLGLLPAVHPTIGGWAWVIACLATVGDRTDLGGSARRAWPWFAIGALMAGASAAAHFARYPFVSISPDQQAHYLQLFLTHWNSHGQLYGVDRLIAAVCLLMFYVALIRLRPPQMSSGPLFVCRCLVTGASLGLVLWAVALIEPVDIVPLVRSLMPSRLVNLPVLGGMAIMIGLLARTRTRWASAVLVALAATGFAQGITEITLSALALAIVVWSVVMLRGASAAWSGQPPMWMSRAAIALMLLPLPVLVARTMQSRAIGPELVDRTNDGFWRIVAERPGALLTGPDFHLVQAVTRRPVLVDGGGIDALGYVPQMGPRLEVILRDVYALELSAPGHDSPQGVLSGDAGLEVWTRRTANDWQVVAARYGFTDILTRDDWTLQLPLVAESDGLRLYSIPAVGERQ